MKSATDEVDVLNEVTRFALKQAKKLLDDSTSERELLVRLGEMIPERIMVRIGQSDATADQLRALVVSLILNPSCDAFNKLDEGATWADFRSILIFNMALNLQAKVV